MITGAELFVKALKAEGVNTLFAYPGGQAIDLFDALYGEKEIDVILPRHEQGLIHAADGYARSTGRVGVCLVTSGPGAANLVTGIATANFDSVPLVCFTGQVPTGLIGNDAFQEVDIVGITRSICKYAVTVRKREELGDIIKKAFVIAKTGRPGVVVVDLPKDIQKEYGSGCYPENVEIRGCRQVTGAHAGQVRRAMEALKQAKRPLFLLGGGVIISRAKEEMRYLAEATGIPVVTTIMGKGAIPTTHPCMWEISAFTVHMPPIRQSASEIFFFPSAQDSMIVLPESRAALRPGPPLSMWILIRPPYPGIFPWIFRLLPMQDRRSARFVKEPVLWKQVRGESRLENGRNSIP